MKKELEESTSCLLVPLRMEKSFRSTNENTGKLFYIKLYKLKKKT